MFTTKFTLVLYLAIVLALSTGSESKGYATHNTNLKRLVRKRSPFPAEGLLSGLVGAGSDPAATTPSSSAASETSATASVTSVASQTSTSASISSASSASSSSVSSSSSASSSQSSSESSSSSSSPSSSSSVASSTTQQSSTVVVVPSTTDQVAPVNTAKSNPSTSVALVTLTASSAAASDTTVPVASGASSKTKTTTITVLIVIAAVVGGVAIFWTVFRKWKLARSSKFDERLQPIDWQPTADEAAPDLRRTNSMASSFHSASGHGNAAGRGATPGYGATSNIPEHDFTAVPSNLAPVGGYADLSRGPSPQMQDLGRGPSMNRPNYGGEDYNYNVNHGPRY